MGQREC